MAYPEDTGTLDAGGAAGSNVNLVTMNLFDRLVVLGDDKKFHPALATSWEYSADGKALTFRLRKDVKFHDGNPLTAEAVKYTFDRVKDPTTKSSTGLAQLGADYLGTDVVDEFTVRMNFKAPFAPMLAGLSLSHLAPVSPANARAGSLSTRPAGTGPFRLAEWVPQQRLKLERNPDYAWAPEKVFAHQGPAYLDAVTYRFMPEASARVAALETGEVDFVRGIPVQDVKRLESDKRFKVQGSISIGSPVMVLPNTAKAPTDDIAVRRAMAHAIDRKALIEAVYFGAYKPAYSPITRATFGYDASLEQGGGLYPTDKVKARALLDAAGWTVGPNGIRQKAGKQLDMVFLFRELFFDKPLAELIQAQLREVGINVTIRSEAAAAFLRSAANGEHNLLLARGVSPDPNVMRNTYHSDQIRPNGFAWSFLRSGEFDTVAVQASSVMPPDSVERAGLLARVQRVALEQVATIPVLDMGDFYAHKAGVRGVWIEPGTNAVFYDAWKERS